MSLLVALTVCAAQAQRFNKNTDILVAQFDSKPDPDDIHSIAALGCLLAHPDFSGVNYYAVAGAVGINNPGKYIPAPALFNMAFGAENTNWTDAFGSGTSSADQAKRNASITRIKDKVKPILQAGGKVFVQEAGSSTITQDWVNALKNDGVSNSVIKNGVVVVQHSNWNEDRMDTDANRNNGTRPNLNQIKSDITYSKIGDGNGTGNGTPSYRVTNTSFRISAEASSNPNTKARNLWLEADRVIQANGHLPSHSSITTGGVDFSDCVENWWIFELGSNVDNVDKFWNRYVTNSNSNQGTPASPAPTGDGTPPGGGGGDPGNGTPFGGTPRTIPGLIQAEDFNVGAQGVAYSDTDNGNNGNSSHRNGANVDITDGTSADPARLVGWIANGEWLEYDVNVTPGTYDIEARVASNSGNPGDLAISIDGTSLGTFAVENTGGWRSLETVIIPNVILGIGGARDLRLTAVGGSFNIDSVSFVAAGTTPPPPPPPAGNGNFQEANGLLVMEAENATLPANWNTVTSVPANDPSMAGFTGDGYIEWTGAQVFGLTIPSSQAQGVITYTFTINNPGTYSFRWRTKQKNAGQTFDAGNDSFVRFASGTTPAGSENFGQFTKVFIQNKTSWDLNVRAEPRVENGSAVFVTNAFRRVFTAGTHSIQLAARSPGHAIDRLILHRSDVPFNAATFASAPESPRDGDTTPPPPPPPGPPAPPADNGNGTAFGDTPRAIPGLIEAEDFNAGGEDVAYNDTGAGNNGGSPYRDGENVDIADGNATEAARFIGWIADGEFWNYAVNVTPGTYNIEARIASNAGTPGSLAFTIDSADLGTIDVTNTSGWRTFQTFTLPNVTFGIGGARNLRLSSIGGSYNVDSIRFAPVGGSPQTVNAAPSDDIYLQSGNPVAGNLLRIQPSGPVREAYLKFNVTGVNGAVTGSKLNLTVAGDDGSGTVSVYRGATDSWTEGNITSANAPARGALLGTANGSFGIGSNVEIDLGTNITGNGTVSLIVVLNSGGNDVGFSSKEGANAPSLQVTSTP